MFWIFIHIDRTPNSIHMNMFWIFISVDRTPNSFNTNMFWISIHIDISGYLFTLIYFGYLFP